MYPDSSEPHRHPRPRRVVALQADATGGYGTLGNPNEAIDAASAPSTVADGPAPEPPTGVQID